MATKDPKKTGGASGEPKSAWGARGVKGVVPPGRRLAKPEEKRRARWSASGVNGIAPPGKQKPGEGPADAWAIAKDKGIRPSQVGKKVAKGKELSPARPTVGFVPDLAVSAGDPKDWKSYLDLYADFFRDNPLQDDNAEALGQLIGQSHAPFPIMVGFTILSAWVGAEGDRRRTYQWALERGAKVYFNMAKRLDASVRPPRGLVPRSVDPLFYSLPQAAFQIPFAYGVDAFGHILELCRGDTNYDRKLLRFFREMRGRFVEKRSYGDKEIATMFPWDEPAWAPHD
ncbi:MAG: hypothetical protein U1E65_08835 [Myxococcota bacterium]